MYHIALTELCNSYWGSSRDTIWLPNAILTDAQAAYNAVQDHPTTQSLKDTVSKGQVGVSEVLTIVNLADH